MVDILKESIEHKKAEQEQLHKLKSREMDLRLQKQQQQQLF